MLFFNYAVILYSQYVQLSILRGQKEFVLVKNISDCIVFQGFSRMVPMEYYLFLGFRCCFIYVSLLLYSELFYQYYVIYIVLDESIFR